MASPEALGEILARSQQALAETLAGALQNLKYQRAPAVKLTKFYGPPRKTGGPTLVEWLDDLDTYCRQLGLKGDEKVSALLDHLGGVAKEEILCCPSQDCKDFEKLIVLLHSRFGAQESVQSLTSAFYTRTQLEDETLADFGRALMLFYNRVEAAATDPQEGEALARLREKALKEQFIKGAARPYVRRELRKLEIDYQDLSFFEFRDVALKLFQDLDTVSGPVHDSSYTSSSPMLVDKAASRPCDQTSLASMNEKQDQLIKLVESMTVQLQEVGKVVVELSKVVGQLANNKPQPRRPVPQCTYCGKRGHGEEVCFKRQNDLRRASQAVDPPLNTPQAGTQQTPSAQSDSGKVGPLS